MATAGAAAKPRKRIVPEMIISPVKEATTQPATAEALSFDQVDLQKQAEIAAEVLGPGRKVYIRLEEDPAKNIVNWYKLMKERGVKTSNRASKKAPDDPIAGGSSLLSLPSRPQPAMNPLQKVIQRLERAVGMTEQPSDDEDSVQDMEGDSSASEDGAVGGGGSDDEEGDGAEGGEGAAGGEATTEGNAATTNTEEGGAPVNTTDAAAAAGGEGNAEGQPATANGEAAVPADPAAAAAAAAAAKKRRARGDEYDYNDPFFDDTEFYNRIEHADKRKPKHDGFYISKGFIERTEEFLPGFEGAGKKKRKAGGADALDADGNPIPGTAKKAAPKRQRDEVVIGEDGKPIKQAPKRRKKDAQQPTQILPTAGMSLAQMAMAAATGVTAGAPVEKAPKKVKPPAPPVVPYIPPQDLLDAIEEVRAIAKEAPPPVVTVAGEKPLPKRLPQTVVDALKSAEPIFLREHHAHRPQAAKYMMDELYKFLEPYTTWTNLRLYVSGRPTGGGRGGGGAHKEKPILSRDLLKELVEKTVKAPTVLSETDDDFRPLPSQGGGDSGGNGGGNVPRGKGQRWKDVPLATRREVYRFVNQQLGGKDVSTPVGSALLQELLTWFPMGALELIDLERMIQQEKSKEVKAAEGGPSGGGGGQKAGGGGGSAGGSAEITPQGSPGGSGGPQQQQEMQQLVAAAAAGSGLTPQQVMEALANPGLMAQLAVASGAAAANAAATAKQTAAVPANQPKSKEPTPAPETAAPPQPTTATATATGSPGNKLDETIITTAINHGAPEPTIRALLDATKSGPMYQNTMIRVLASIGPKGATVADMVTEAVKIGLRSEWAPTAPSNVKNGLSRSTHHEAVAHLGKFKYALKCFPGVVDVPRKQSKGAQATGASEAGPSVADETNGEVGTS